MVKRREDLVSLIDELLATISLPPSDFPASDYQPSERNPEDSTYNPQENYRILDNDPDEEKYGGSSSGTNSGGGALESSQ